MEDTTEVSALTFAGDGDGDDIIDITTENVWKINLSVQFVMLH